MSISSHFWTIQQRHCPVFQLHRCYKIPRGTHRLGVKCSRSWENFVEFDQNDYHGNGMREAHRSPTEAYPFNHSVILLLLLLIIYMCVCVRDKDKPRASLTNVRLDVMIAGLSEISQQSKRALPYLRHQVLYSTCTHSIQHSFTRSTGI